MNVRHLYLLAAMLAITGLQAAPASAQFTEDGFTRYGNSRAGWIETRTPPPGAADPSSIELFVNAGSSTDFGDAAFVEFKGFGSAPPARSPSYDFRPSASGRGGGSPRLIMSFSDGKGYLRPLNLVAGGWTRLDGSDDWDTYGGSCGYRSQLSYAALLGCHPGARVNGVQILNDSGWLYPGGFGVLVDNVTYGGATVSRPAGDVKGDTAAAPVLGRRVEVTPVSGEVFVRTPGEGPVPLDTSDGVPIGSLVDAREGAVKLLSAKDRRGALQSGRFSGGRFRVLQSRKSDAEGVTELRLRGGSYRPCRVGRGRGASSQTSGPRSRVATRARSRHKVRRVRASASRYYRTRGKRSASRPSRKTKGRRSASSANGANWDTIDRCDGTLTVVRRGNVTVRDFRRNRSIVLGPGERYLARAP